MNRQTPQETARFLDKVLDSPHRLSTMLWGPPGVGKSSLVVQAAERSGMDFVQLELAVLPPQELMGLPYVQEGTSRYALPTFWPTSSRGVLVLEDLPHALPVVQAMGMSLILEGRVGPHVLPEGWRVVGTGNRVQDGAGAFKMPTATASRMIHLAVQVDNPSWREWALSNGVEEDILGLLGLRPELLHQLDRDQPAWPSPRTWVMASHLHRMGLDAASAVGEGAAAELQAYSDVKRSLPDLAPILEGRGGRIPWPEEMSLRWALVVGLAFKANTTSEVRHAFGYLSQSAGAEWQSLFMQDTTTRFRSSGRLGELAVLLTQEPALAAFIDGILELVA